jgi:hypothetical protein
MFFLLFLCDLVVLGGAKKSLIFNLWFLVFTIQKSNTSNEFNCIKSKRILHRRGRRARTTLHRGKDKMVLK